jgi:hypothetical protein
MTAIRLLKFGVEKLRSEIEIKRGVKSTDKTYQSCRDLLTALEEERDKLTKPSKEMTERLSDTLETGDNNRTFVSV